MSCPKHLPGDAGEPVTWQIVDKALIEQGIDGAGFDERVGGEFGMTLPHELKPAERDDKVFAGGRGRTKIGAKAIGRSAVGAKTFFPRMHHDLKKSRGRVEQREMAKVKFFGPGPA